MELPDAAEHPPKYEYTVTGARKKSKCESRPEQLGKRIKVNGREVALFRYRFAPVAIAAQCPHMRGDMQLADIEDFNNRLCVTCPVHHYMFELSTGALVRPEGKTQQYRLQTYHARVTREGFIEIGFRTVGEELFATCDC